MATKFQHQKKKIVNKQYQTPVNNITTTTTTTFSSTTVLQLLAPRATTDEDPDVKVAALLHITASDLDTFSALRANDDDTTMEKTLGMRLPKGVYEKSSGDYNALDTE
ncbi:hypothetical protein JHK84_039466 [Glycine max]|nr:hypothetical protein JHK86_039238 [Glycine max]KAG5121126.1 hypothetical protein JHK84_039466 [Glycine max]